MAVRAMRARLPSMTTLASASASTSSASSCRRSFASSKPTIVELRESALLGARSAEYMADMSSSPHLPSLRLFAMPETGGKLNVATSLYSYPGGLQQRDAATDADEACKAAVEAAACHPAITEASSLLFTEAPFIAEMGDGVRGIDDISPFYDDGNKNAIFELRRYQLQLGYTTVPKFIELYTTGLPSKLEAPGTDPSTSLCTVLASEIGQLNEVIEVWRHGNGSSAMEASRAASRAAGPWRAAIAEIAGLATSFRTTVYKPTSFSVWK